MQHPPLRASYASTSAGGSATNQARHAQPHTHSVNRDSHDQNAHDKVASASTALDRVLGLMDGFEDEMECPLCLEEMDISDLNFKPCPCGYQICRFCFHHIKENLNNRCPACRATYEEATVEFKAIKPDELKRLQAAKKLRDKRRKDEAANVKNMANIRVRQRTQVHIQGMTSKIANEDTVGQLKGPDHFGQYGKVLKIYLSKRNSTVTQPASTHPHYQALNVYVHYRNAAEATTCIHAIDGTTTPDGHKLKAIWGNCRYCPVYLKGAKCNNENCMMAHEPGEEIETTAAPASREEIYSYQAVSDTDLQRSKSTGGSAAVPGKTASGATLPATASWASKNAPAVPAQAIVYNPNLPPLSATLPKPTPPRQVPKPTTHPLPARPASRPKADSNDPARVPGRRSQIEQAAALAAATSTPPASSPVLEHATLPLQPSSSVPDICSSPSPSPPPVVLPPGLVPPTIAPVASSSQPPSPVRVAPPPAVPTFPDLGFGFGDGGFNFSLDLDAKGKGRAMPLRPVGREERSHEFADLNGFPRPSPLPMADLFSPGGAPPSSYMGTFDPFAIDFTAPFADRHDTPSPDPADASRRGSRFDFARQPSFAPPPGIGLPPHLQRQASNGSSAAFSPLPPPNLSGDWASGPYSALTPGVAARLAGPSPGQSTTSSPQLSPRAAAATRFPPGFNLGGGANLPPGITLDRPIPAASFPLPPAAPKAGGAVPVDKNDLLRLIQGAKKGGAGQQQPQQQQQPQSSQESHGFFADPAILSSRLGSMNPNLANLPPANGNGNGSAHFSLANGMVGPPGLPMGMGMGMSPGMGPQMRGFPGGMPAHPMAPQAGSQGGLAMWRLQAAQQAQQAQQSTARH